jgi:hypothetical protein
MEVEWSHGPTEGHVNRLRQITRMMNGRTGFESRFRTPQACPSLKPRGLVRARGRWLSIRNALGWTTSENAWLCSLVRRTMSRPIEAGVAQTHLKQPKNRAYISDGLLALGGHSAILETERNP